MDTIQYHTRRPIEIKPGDNYRLRVHGMPRIDGAFVELTHQLPHRGQGEVVHKFLEDGTLPIGIPGRWTLEPSPNELRKVVTYSLEQDVRPPAPPSVEERLRALERGAA